MSEKFTYTEVKLMTFAEIFEASEAVDRHQEMVEKDMNSRQKKNAARNRGKFRKR